MKKSLKIILLIAIMCICAAGCAKKKTEQGFADKLASLKGVTSITVIEQESPVFAEKYLITFSQPIDWAKPELGSFEQRVEVGFNSYDSYTFFNVGGYTLSDQYFALDDRSEIAYISDACNFVNVEYRFFGESCPWGLSNDSTQMWEYLTNENASADFHAIMEALKTLLTNRWYICGSSKGGQAVNVYAYYYPDDCFAYAAYVAPFADGIAQPGLVDTVFTTAGDSWLGTEKAAKRRADLMTIIVDLVENREILQQQYWDNAIGSGNQYRSFVTPEILYDMALLETYIEYWQMPDYAEDIESILALKEANPKDYITACYRFMLEQASPEYWSTNSPFYPYYIQAKKENGCYYYDFKYIREALKAAGLAQSLAITEEMEKDILWNVVFTEEQNAAFTYDSSLRDEVIGWLDTTDSNIIMVYGAVDPWTAVRLPDTDNPHIGVYIVPDMGHNAMFTFLTDEAQLMDAYIRLFPEMANNAQ